MFKKIVAGLLFLFLAVGGAVVAFGANSAQCETPSCCGQCPDSSCC